MEPISMQARLMKAAKTALLTGACVLSFAVLVLFIEISFLPSCKDPQVTTLTLPQAKQIPNFDYVHSYLLRGGMPSPEGVQWLKQNGINTIVDLRETENSGVLVENLLSRALGVNYINIPVKRLPSADQIQQFLTIVDQSKSKGERVFVHCSHGSDRTGIFVGSCRVMRESWRPTQALAEMLEGGFLIHRFYPGKMTRENSKRTVDAPQPISSRAI